MKLSPVIQRYFDAWIQMDTWDSYHPLDQERFYRFIKSVKRYSKRKPAPSEIEKMIIERWKGRRVKRHLIASAQRYASRYEIILKYEATRGFPNWLIERTSLPRCYLALAIDEVSPKKINEIMTRLWGKDWQSELEKWSKSLAVPLSESRKKSNLHTRSNFPREPW